MVIQFKKFVKGKIRFEGNDNFRKVTELYKI